MPHTQRVLRTTRILTNFQIRPENNNPYNTRNRDKMNTNGTIKLHYNTNKFEINQLLYGMNNLISGIKIFLINGKFKLHIFLKLSLQVIFVIE